MLPLLLQNIFLITFSLFAHRFQSPVDLPYIPASSAMHATHNTSSTHLATQVVPARCLEMEIPTVSKELSLAQAPPMWFQDQLLKWVIYEAF